MEHTPTVATPQAGTSMRASPTPGHELADAYLELVERALTFSLYEDVDGRPRLPWIGRPLNAVLLRMGMRLVQVRLDPRVRAEGLDWPLFAQTMVGHARLSSLRRCVQDVIAEEIHGDLIEAGVWRGGAAIMMRAVLRAYGVRDRTVVLADSFVGFPRPGTEDRPLDAGRPDELTELAVSEEEVRANFERYGLLDDQVRFVRGWFADTMPLLAGNRWSLIRLDADTYGATIDALTALYPGLAPGGYLIVDDYGAVPACRAAVDHFRAAHRITEPIEVIDSTGVLWRRQCE